MAARAARHPARAVAAGRRRRRRRPARSSAVAGTHGKSTTAGWLVHVLVAAGADPVGVRRRAAADVGDRRAAGDGPLGPRRRSSSRRTSTPATSTRTGRRSRSLTSAEWDHPDVFADEAAVIDAFERWLRGRGRRPRRAAADARRQRRRPGRGGCSAGASSDWPGTRSSPRWSTLPRSASTGTAAGSPTSSRTAAGPAGAARRGSPRPTATARPSSSSASTLLGEPAAGPPADGRAPQRRQRARRRGGGSALGLPADRDRRRASPRSRASGGASSARARRPASSSTTTTATTRRRSARRSPRVRQREPGRRVWAVYEPLTYHRTAALLDEFADVLADADAVAVADIWAGRDPDTTVASAAGARGGRRAPPARRSPSAPRARSRRRPPGWPARSEPATPSSSWAAAGATGSASCCWSEARRVATAAERRDRGSTMRDPAASTRSDPLERRCHGILASAADSAVDAGSPDVPIASWRTAARAVGADQPSPRGRALGVTAQAGETPMAGDVSFDVVSDFDEQELRNALDQVRREVQQRYDFKGVTVELTQAQGRADPRSPTTSTAPPRSRTSSSRRRSGATCRSRSSTGARSSRPAATRSARRSGCGAACRTSSRKRLTKLIRDEFPKVKSQIQGDAVRVSGKSKDELQKVIARLRELDEPVPLQFQNYR